MADEPEYRFRHVLVSDVCYERLPLGERIARHVRTADWLEARLDGRGTDLAEVVAHHRFTAYQTSQALGLDARPYAGPALAALRQAARRAAMLNAFDAAATLVARANQLVGDFPLGDQQTSQSSETDRLGVELLGVELAFHADEAAFLGGPGPARLAELATLLYRARDHAGAARAWTLLGQTAWLRLDRAEALRCLDRAVELFDTCPDTPEKAQAYAELGQLHMLNYEHVPALGATQIAAEIADRLGLVELHANALITIGLCRYLAGEPDGLVDLDEAREFCRRHQLPSLRRAARTVAYAMREEGASFDADSVPDGDVPAVAFEAFFAGDWDRFLATAESFVDTPDGDRELRVRACRAWLRALRGDGDGAHADSARALAVARSSGFWRPTWTALAHGACCEALLDQRGSAEELLRELGEGWRRMRTIASGEWVAAAAHAADRVGSDAALLLRDALGDAPHHTAWSRAAMAAMDGTLAAGRGDYTTAAVRHLDAADRYAKLGSATDRMLALGSAVRALSAAADRAVFDSRALASLDAQRDPRFTIARGELAEFARRNRIVSPL